MFRMSTGTDHSIPIGTSQIKYKQCYQIVFDEALSLRLTEAGISTIGSFISV